MDSLGPNASAEEIEAEIAFFDIMLSTLDPDDFQFEETKAQYEATLAELHARLHQKAAPIHNPPSTPRHHEKAHRNDRGVNLPSRERDSTQNLAPIRSPLNHRSNLDVYGGKLGASRTASNSADSSPSSTSRPNKRPHDGWSFGKYGEQNEPRKVARLDDSHSESAASTPATTDSLEILDNAVAQSLNFNINATRDNIMKRIQEQQRQEEFRIKREKEDEEFARALQLSNQAQPSSSSVQQRVQSFLDETGRVNRPLPPSNPQIPVKPSLVGLAAPSLHVKREHNNAGVDTNSNLSYKQTQQAPPSWNSNQRAAATNPAQVARNSYTSQLQDINSDDDDGDDDDELEEISPAQFAASRQIKSPGAAPFSNYSSMSNAWGVSGATNYPISYVANGYVPAGYVPAGGQNQMIGGTSVYNSSQNATAGFRQSGFGPALSRGVQSAASALGEWWDGFSSVAGVIGGNPITGGLATQKRRPGNPLNMGNDLDLGIGGSNAPTRTARDFDADLHARGLDYMLSDPTRTREELEQLLENIRPDEDIPPEMRIGTPEALNIALMEHQKLGLAWLKAQEEGSNKGGILADDMGLGKTIQAISLIVSRPSEDRARRTTLIVAPVALLRQWKEEIDEKVRRGHKLRVYIFHGAKPKDTFATLSTYDVVMTTFGKVAGEYARQEVFRRRKAENPAAIRRSSEKLVLLAEESRWYRVIIDEAQCIKNKSTKAALGCSHLNSLYRLCMTGTPMMNNVGELYSLIHFLRIPPYNELERFNREFKKPLSSVSQHSKDRAMKALQVLLKAILLRRTKKSEIDGRPILNLPERSTEIVHAVFDEDQDAFYKALETETQLAVNKYLQKGKMGKNYSYILVRLLRLRQACCHPHLIKDFAEDAPSDVPIEDMKQLAEDLDAGVVARIKGTNGNFECPICYDATENPTIFFPCGHDVCSECFTKITDPAQAIANGNDGSVEAKCPECRSKVDPKKILSWRAFVKVHLPEQYVEEEVKEAVGKEEDDDSDTESDSDDSEDNDDADRNGDLRGFIVNDDEEEEDEAETEDEENVKPEPTDDEKPSSSRRRNTKSKKASKWKGKGKAVAKKKEKKTMAQLKQESLRNAKAKKRYLRRIRRQWISSAKIDKTIEVLTEIRRNDPEEKTIIFSQFTSLLDLLEVAIDDGGWRYRRYDGSMSARLRDEAVTEFKKDKNVKIMLVSLKAGNAGLNLTAASQVIILDPFWNPFIEEQAIDRAHRIGQIRPVQVHRILVENTVEDRIILLQEKKRDLINQALDEKAAQSMSRLGRAELAYLFGITSTVQREAD